jgi:hypothetical protein
LALLLGCPALIIWLGGDAISHIGELYDGLCPAQALGLYLYDGKREGYCTGIGSDLEMLGLIMAVATIAVPSALGGFWYSIAIGLGVMVGLVVLMSSST